MLTNIPVPSLVQLASHYSVSGWERWQRSRSDDSDVTEYHDLSDAVAAHSEQCLMILAAKWGLRYAELEQPRPKRRTETDDSQPSRRVRARKESSDEVVESVFSRDESGRVVRQDRLIMVGERLHIAEEVSITDVLEQYPLPPGHRRMSVETAELGWGDSPNSGSRKSLKFTSH
jgi:hypothetical protein